MILDQITPAPSNPFLGETGGCGESNPGGAEGRKRRQDRKEREGEAERK